MHLYRNKSKSKNSILESAAIYIQELQQKNSDLSEQLGHSKYHVTNDMSHKEAAISKGMKSAALSSTQYSARQQRDASSVQARKIKCFSLTNSDYHELFFSVPIPWALSDIEGRIIDCNHTFEKTSGYKREELLTYTICNLVPNSALQSAFTSLAWLLESSNLGASPPVNSSGLSSKCSKSSQRSGSITLAAQLSRSILSSNRSQDSCEGGDVPIAPTKAFNLVISLVRKVVDLSPQYFHILLLPSLKD